MTKACKARRLEKEKEAGRRRSLKEGLKKETRRIKKETSRRLKEG